MWEFRATTRSSVTPWRLQAAPSVLQLRSTGWKRSSAAAKRASGVRPLLELIPEGPELDGLVAGQHPEDPVRGERLALVLAGHPRRVVGERVAGVDLHEVVDDEHLQHAQDVDPGVVRVLGQDDGRETQVPGVLGVVLGPAALRAGRLPEDLLQLVDLEDESYLRPQPLVGHAA